MGLYLCGHLSSGILTQAFNVAVQQETASLDWMTVAPAFSHATRQPPNGREAYGSSPHWPCHPLGAEASQFTNVVI
ncbi:hypothetical protein FOBRF1_008820 [Fusarium oxysporum]